MARYLITQSLISSWAYMFDCYDGGEEDAQAEFMRVLQREPGEQTQAMRNGIEFENEVYAASADWKRKPHECWEDGIQAVSKVIYGAPVQVRLSRPITVNGVEFLVYGILDALKAGVIYDVKFSSKPLSGFDAYGKYLNSPQHPFYFYLAPEAYEFRYLLSDGIDLYQEVYRRSEVLDAAAIIGEFLDSISCMGLLDLYKEKWVAK